MNTIDVLHGTHWLLQATTASRGYAGTGSEIVSAALQACGILVQESILKNLQQIFQHAGALIYIFALIGGLFSLAVFGNYKRALATFIAPAVFWALISATEQARPTGIRFGAREEPNIADPVIRQIAANAPNGPIRTAEVSWFFARFDGIVTETVQGLVSLLVNQKNQEDVVVKAREGLFARLLLYQPNDPNFMYLLAWTLDGECGKLGRELQEMAYTRRGDIDPKTGKERAFDPDAVVRLRARYDLAMHNLPDSLLVWLKSQRVAPQDARNPVSCNTAWRWTFNYTEHLAKNIENEYNRGAAPSPTPLMGGNQLQSQRVPWTQVHTEVLRLLSRDRENKGFYAAGYAADTEAGLPPPSPDIMGLISQEDRDLALRVLAAFWLKNTWVNTPHGNMTDTIFTRMGMRRIQKESLFNTYANRNSYGGFMRIMYFAAAIPYFQGLLLFLLTASFPFFCFFMLVPGKASNFLAWMALWVWVKSWDVGFALLIVVRKVLFEFVAPGYGASVARDGIPENAFRVALASDPLAQLNTYYTVVGILYCSIPLLTAHFCFGATNLFEAFKFGIDHNANRFAQRKSKESMRYAASISQMKADKARADNYLNNLYNRVNADTTLGTVGSLADFKKAVMEGGDLSAYTQNKGKDGSASDPQVQANTARQHIAAAKSESYGFKFDQANRDNQGAVAMFSGRRSFGGQHASIGLIEGAVNDHNQAYTRTSSASGQNSNEQASTLAGNMSTSIDVNGFLDAEQGQ